MKQLHQFLDDTTYELLLTKKGKRTWTVFLTDVAQGDAYRVPLARTPAPHESQ